VHPGLGALEAREGEGIARQLREECRGGIHVHDGHRSAGDKNAADFVQNISAKVEERTML
jgi:hypothetical protein